MPTRESMQRRPQPGRPAPPAELPAELEHVDSEQPVPVSGDAASLEERLGTAGIMLMAILIAVLSAVITMLFMR